MAVGQHRAGKLKQSNKKFKSRGSTRPSKEGRVQGRVEKRTSGGPAKGAATKAQRLNRAKQLLQSKRETAIRQKRQYVSAISRVIGVIPTSGDVTLPQLIEELASRSSEWEVLSTETTALYHVAALLSRSQRCTYTFITVNTDNEETNYNRELLEMLSVSDSLLLLSKFDGEARPLIDDSGMESLRLISSFGVPAVTLAVCTGVANALNIRTLNKYCRAEFEKLHASIFNTLAVADLKTVDVKDGFLSKHLAEVKTNAVRWKSQRSHILSEEVIVLDQNEENDTCTLQIRGVLRGSPMYLHTLMHFNNVGVGEVVSVSRPDGSQKVMADPSRVDTMDSEAVPDNLMGEQTWPDEHDMVQMDGMAEQFSEGEQDIDSDGEDLNDIRRYYENELKEPSKNANKDDMLEDLEDFGEKKRIVGVDDTDQQYRDYFDLSPEEDGRVRLARYRAMQNFRNSFWHPKENLPPQYGRIFSFDDFKGLAKSVMNTVEEVSKLQVDATLAAIQNKKAKGNDMDMDAPPADFLTIPEADDFIASDQRVDIVVKNVPRMAAATRLSAAGFLVGHSLHRHENKLSICHYNIRRVPGDETQIKSKDTLLFYTAFRSFVCRPIFSESNLNCDKHKYYRYLPEDGFSAATAIAPVCMTECPLLIFRLSESGGWSLVATGQAMSVDPDRIILKKMILTGNPIRVRKKMAVIKHMFYNPLDVRWFRPAELVTLHGLRGNITESVGTHGLFKAAFSAVIKQNDQVMLILYKRVFPKFLDDVSSSGGNMGFLDMEA